MRPRLLLCLVCSAAATSAVASSARADGGVTLAPAHAAADDAPPTTHRHWYGWQTLSLDLAAIMMGAPALTLQDEGWRTAAVLADAGVYLGGAPLVHAFHGRPLAALASLGIRAVIPAGLTFAGWGVGMAAADSCERAHPGWDSLGCGVDVAGFMLLGGLAGFVGTSVLDAAWLGFEKLPGPSAVAWSLGPLATPGGAGVAAAGTF